MATRLHETSLLLQSYLIPLELLSYLSYKAGFQNIYWTCRQPLSRTLKRDKVEKGVWKVEKGVWKVEKAVWRTSRQWDPRT